MVRDAEILPSRAEESQPEHLSPTEACMLNAYRKARLLSFRQTMGLLQKAAPLAVQVLVKVASDVAAPHSSKVSAATALLKHSRESLELDDVVARVEALERATKGAA